MKMPKKFLGTIFSYISYFFFFKHLNRPRNTKYNKTKKKKNINKINIGQMISTTRDIQGGFYNLQYICRVKSYFKNSEGSFEPFG